MGCQNRPGWFVRLPLSNGHHSPSPWLLYTKRKQTREECPRSLPQGAAAVGRARLGGGLGQPPQQCCAETGAAVSSPCLCVLSALAGTRTVLGLGQSYCQKAAGLWSCERVWTHSPCLWAPQVSWLPDLPIAGQEINVRESSVPKHLVQSEYLAGVTKEGPGVYEHTSGIIFLCWWTSVNPMCAFAWLVQFLLSPKLLMRAFWNSLAQLVEKIV